MHIYSKHFPISSVKSNILFKFLCQPFFLMPSKNLYGALSELLYHLKQVNIISQSYL